jgi:2-amino-4-hydroxy-6-hydroxymethyldihydropteridine diphosphokinase
MRNLNEGIQALESLGSFCFFSKQHLVPAILPPSDLKRTAPDYLNQVALFLCNLEPSELYLEIKFTEDRLGHPRNTGQMWPDRHLDMDLLLLWEKLRPDAEESVPAILNEQGWEPKAHISAEVVIPHRELKNRTFLWKMLEEAWG